MTPDEKLERVRMCLAEAGYDPSEVSLLDEGRFIFPLEWPIYPVWKARALTGIAQTCWPCRRAQGTLSPSGPRVVPCGHPVDPFCSEHAEAVA